jgi:hypothetical protein
MEELTQVLVFKTNIEAEQKPRMLELLRAENFIHDVSIDVEDCDRVLRIVGDDVQSEQIVKMVTNEGFYCEVLD